MFLKSNSILALFHSMLCPFADSKTGGSSPSAHRKREERLQRLKDSGKLCAQGFFRECPASKVTLFAHVLIIFGLRKAVAAVVENLSSHV